MRPNGEDVHVGVGAGVPAGVAANEDGGFGSLPRQPVCYLAGNREYVIRWANLRHSRAALAGV